MTHCPVEFDSDYRRVFFITEMYCSKPSQITVSIDLFFSLLQNSFFFSTEWQTQYLVHSFTHTPIKCMITKLDEIRFVFYIKCSIPFLSLEKYNFLLFRNCVSVLSLAVELQFRRKIIKCDLFLKKKNV